VDRSNGTLETLDGVSAAVSLAQTLKTRIWPVSLARAIPEGVPRRIKHRRAVIGMALFMVHRREAVRIGKSPSITYAIRSEDAPATSSVRPSLIAALSLTNCMVTG
jgi:hypothetical protein